MKYLIAIIISLLLVFAGYKLAEAAVQMTYDSITKDNAPLEYNKLCESVESGALIEENGSFCRTALQVTTNNGSQLETYDPQATGINK